MTKFGTIKFYDSSRGCGTIIPERGGDALPFKRADLREEDGEPSVDDRYRYDTGETDTGQRFATLLTPEGESSVVEQQARAQRG